MIGIVSRSDNTQNLGAMGPCPMMVAIGYVDKIDAFQVLMFKVPSPFDISQFQVFTIATGNGPRVPGINTRRGGVEIALLGLQGIVRSVHHGWFDHAGMQVSGFDSVQFT